MRLELSTPYVATLYRHSGIAAHDFEKQISLRKADTCSGAEQKDVLIAWIF